MANMHPVPFKTHPGRKPKNILRSETMQLLAETSPRAAKYLQGVSDGKELPNRDRIDVCKYIIDQDVGRPTQKTELTGAAGGDIVIRIVEDGNSN